MTDNILAFPSFTLLPDRKTIVKSGKSYRGIRALVADMSMPERKATLPHK